MYLARVDFGRPSPERRRDALENEAWEYLCALYWNGNLYDDLMLGRAGDRVSGSAFLSGVDALEPAHEPEHAALSRARLRERFNSRPRWGILDRPATRTRATWRGAPMLVLRTDAHDSGPPVRHGGTGAPIPSYRLPLSFEQRRDILYWAQAFQHLDQVWLDSGPLEVVAYRQCAEPRSDTSRSGRDVCRIIEAATGIATYYHLPRYYGRRAGELARQCPGCGDRWCVHRGARFPLGCEPCRLMSGPGVEFGEPKLAKIGEWRGARRRARGRS